MSADAALSAREIAYFRQRLKNRVYGQIVAFVAEEAERRPVSRKDIARRLGRDPAQITRWLANPSNLTLETISDLLLAMGAECDLIVERLADRPAQAPGHPLLTAIAAMGHGDPEPPLPPRREVTVAASDGPGERSPG